MKWILLLVAALQTSVLYGVSISSNPGAVNIEVGTGVLGEKLGFSKNSGLRVGGLWLGDENYLYCGGVKPHHWSGNSLFILDFSADMEKMICWNGAKFGTSFLQFNGSPTNADAGSVQGYNSLPGPSPLNRSELYELWYRQELFNNKFVIRIGKIVPSYDFNNVIKPLPMEESSLDIPATTGLIYTPVFVDPTLLGVLPGYYNSAYGITATVTPVKSFYASFGFYDGSLARGKQTGLRRPQFKSYYFGIAEIGFDWKIGKNEMPGNLGIGVWNQSGKLTAPPAPDERGIQGIYLFGAQRVWRKAPGVDNSGIIGFYQAGYNNSKTLPMNRYLGGGFTFLGLIPGRLDDNFGFGAAWSRLNRRLFSRKQELIVEGYYQAHLWKSIFFLTALSYIPNPGAGKDLKSVWASTARIIALF